MNRIPVTGASRTIGNPPVKRLGEIGADFAIMSSRPGVGVLGDFRDSASLERAFAGVDTLLLLFPFAPDILALARNAVAGARAAGVRHIVRSSGAGADPARPVLIARAQSEIEALAAASGIPSTFLCPQSFMQNWLSSLAAQVKGGAVYAPHGTARHGTARHGTARHGTARLGSARLGSARLGSARLGSARLGSARHGGIHVIDARDIADAAAAVLVNPTPHAGKTCNLSVGQAMTDAQMPSVISAAIGKEVRYVDVPESAATEAMTGMGVPPVMIDWPMGLNHVIKQGWTVGVSPDGQLLTGHEPRRFEDFVRENLGAWKQGNSVAPGLRSWPRGLNLEAATASRHSRLMAN